MNEELAQLTKLLEKADITKWPMEDQLIAMAAHIEMMKKLKPLLLKNEALNFDGGSFLFKL